MTTAKTIISVLLLVLLVLELLVLMLVLVLVLVGLDEPPGVGATEMVYAMSLMG